MKTWRTITGIILLVLAPAAVGKSAVWQVSNGKHKLYLAGSVHVMRESDYPLPTEFGKAWRQSSVAVFETDMNAGADPQFRQQVMTVFANAPSVTAESLLKPELWLRLRAKATELNMPIEKFQSFHPSFITLMLTLSELTRSGISSAKGVDAWYFQKATAEGRRIQVLETPAEQLSYLASIKQVDVNDGVDIALQDLERLEEMIFDMMEHWRVGEMSKLHTLAMESMGQFPEVYDALIVARNRRWVVELSAMLQSDPVEFVLVGAMHLAGPDSVLKMLDAQGYTVNPLQ